MGRLLTRFWIKRFVQVFLIAGTGLSLAEVAKSGFANATFGSVVVWTVAAAVLAASLSTYWAYKKQCRLALGPRE